MHDHHPAFLPTNLLSIPCSIRWIHRLAESMYFLQHYIILVYDKEIFDWRETNHTDEKCDDDDHWGHPRHPAIPAVVHIARSALQLTYSAFVLMYQQMLCPYLKLLLH